MKITFEGQSLLEIAGEVELFLDMLTGFQRPTEDATVSEPEPEPEAKKEKSKKNRVKKEPVKKEPAASGDGDPGPGTEKEQPVTEKKTPEKTPEEVHNAAISKLTELYNLSGEARKAVKALLAKYEVKKFSEIPMEKATDLFKDAAEIEQVHATETA